MYSKMQGVSFSHCRCRRGVRGGRSGEGGQGKGGHGGRPLLIQIRHSRWRERDVHRDSTRPGVPRAMQRSWHCSCCPKPKRLPGHQRTGTSCRDCKLPCSSMMTISPGCRQGRRGSGSRQAASQRSSEVREGVGQGCGRFAAAARGTALRLHFSTALGNHRPPRSASRW